MDYNKRSNIHVVRVPKQEDKECRAENVIKKKNNSWKISKRVKREKQKTNQKKLQI